jgi:hypothetical protein
MFVETRSCAAALQRSAMFVLDCVELQTAAHCTPLGCASPSTRFLKTFNSYGVAHQLRSLRVPFIFDRELRRENVTRARSDS